MGHSTERHSLMAVRKEHMMIPEDYNAK